MDRTLAEQHLDQAERHIAQGKTRIARQQQLITELERDGHNSAMAHDLLRQYQQTLALHVADRDRLRKELGLGQSET